MLGGFFCFYDAIILSKLLSASLFLTTKYLLLYKYINENGEFIMGRFFKIIFSVAFLIGSVQFLASNTEVQARFITSTEGDRVELPDKYFTNIDSYNKSMKEARRVNDLMNNWVNNPDKTFSELYPEEAAAHPEYAAMGSFNEFVDKRYHSRLTGLSKAETREVYRITYSDYANSMETISHGGLDTEGVKLSGDRGFNAMLTPSDITVFNGTGNSKITHALELGFKEWEKDKRFHFRLVDSDVDARVIVGDSNQVGLSSEYFEKYMSALYVPTIVYDNVLVQGLIVVSPDIEALDASDPQLIHTVIHELGHAIGRPDVDTL